MVTGKLIHLQVMGEEMNLKLVRNKSGEQALPWEGDAYM